MAAAVVLTDCNSSIGSSGPKVDSSLTTRLTGGGLQLPSSGDGDLSLAGGNRGACANWFIGAESPLADSTLVEACRVSSMMTSGKAAMRFGFSAHE